MYNGRGRMAHRTPPLAVLACLAAAAAMGCASRAEPGPPAVGTDEDPALAAARAVASLDPTLARLLAPTDDGWQIERDSITSPGWRAASAGHFDALGARLPVTADGVVEVGVSQIERLRLRIAFEGAGAVGATVDRGRVVYPGAWPSTDAVVATTPTRFELLLFLHDAGAPHDVRWRVQLPHGIAGTRPDGAGGFFFDDLRGEAAMHVARPFAIDSTGARRDADLGWHEGELAVHLDAGGLEFPVVLDPAIETAFWELEQPDASPPARALHAMAYDSARGVSVMFGGGTNSNANSPMGDTWEWDGTHWTQKCTAAACSGTAPPARIAPSMAFDGKNGRTVLFGGDTASQQDANDTWLWDGTAWTPVCNKLPSCTLPPARNYAAMSYDSARSRTVLFGGYQWSGGACPSPMLLQDTWEWDGTSWTQASPKAMPGARYAFGMGYDAKDGVSVLFGGLALPSQFQQPAPTADTWAWNGTSWTQLCAAGACSANVPPARSDHEVAYDSVRSKLVMYGGSSLVDTWEWDGAAWTQSEPALSPPSRTDGAMTFDSKRARVVLFGGTNGSGNALADTWEYHAIGGACTADAQCDTGHCVDGVCCETASCGTCARCDQATNLSPGLPPPGTIGSPGVCSPVTGAQDPDTCTGDKTCDVTGACKGAPGAACTAPTDCASGACPNGCCDGVACVGPDGGPVGGSSGSGSGGGGGSSSKGCGCTVGAPASDCVPAGAAAILIVLGVLARRSRRPALACGVAGGTMGLVASCSLVTPLGELTADWPPDGGDASTGGDAPGEAGSGGPGDAGAEHLVESNPDSASPGAPSNPALWSERFGDSRDQYVYAVAIDSSGNIYVAGAFAGSIDFGADGGAVAATGGLDAFVAKLDSTGHGLWSRSFGDAADSGAHDQLGLGVTVDTAGSVVVVGSFEGTIAFPGSAAIASAGGKDAFYVRLDNTGTVRFTGAASGPDDQIAWAVSADAQQTYYVQASFQNAVTVGGTTYASRGGYDVVTFRLNTNGNLLWSTPVGGPEDDVGTAVGVDSTGRPWTTGYFAGHSNVGPGDAGPLDSDGGYDGFLAAMQTQNGQSVLQQSFGSSGNTYGYAIAVDAIGPGELALAGPFQGGISSFGGTPLVSEGLDDVFVAKLGLTGSPEWGRSFGDPQDQIAYGVTLDHAGAVVVTGSMKGGAKVGASTMLSAGGDDAFLAKFDPGGTPLWGERFGDAMDQSGVAVASTVDNGQYDVVLVGNFQGSIDLGNGPLNTQGGEDFFVAKFGP
jgi:hypothetical protein